MPEGNGGNVGAPERRELECDDLMDNSSHPGEEVRDITVDLGVEVECEHLDVMENYARTEDEVCDVTVELGMKLECDYMKVNSVAIGGAACDITSDRREIEADIDNEKVSDGLLLEATDSVKEEVEDLRNNNDTLDTMIGKTSPPSEHHSTVSHVRKKPTAVIVGADYKFTVRSRYLSSPVGSCHDSCKFGHQHELEKKTSPTSGMIRGTRSLMRTHALEVSKSATKEETKKKTFLRRLSLPSSIKEKDVKLTSEAMSHSKKDLNQSKSKRIKSETKPSSVSTLGQTSRSKIEHQSRDKVVVRNLNLLESSSLGIKAIRTKKEAGSHSKREKEKGKELMSSSFSPTLIKKSPSMKARLYKNLKSFSHSSNLSKSKEAKIDGFGDVPEKTLYMIEPHTDQKPAKRASRFALANESSPNTVRGSCVSKSKDPKGSQKGTHCGHPSSTADLSTSHILKEPSQPGESQPELDSVNTGQIGTITEVGGSKSNTCGGKSMVEDGRSKPNTPRVKSNVERGGSKPNTPRAKSAVGDGGSKPNTPRAKSWGDGGSKPNTPKAKSKGDGGSKPNTPRAKSKGDGGAKPSTPKAKSTFERKIKAKVSCPEETDGSAWKVKFKKGTVVALQVANSAPKKLLFKRGRILGEDQISKNEVVKIVKNRVRRANEPHGTPHDSKQPESGKVRLRHQEATSKKDTIDLNNVIEETASKLVKTRKSKVKALVGAFETVMSLRDRKLMVEGSAS